MNGAEHYSEAERLLTRRVGQIDMGDGSTVPGSLEEPSDQDIALAGVHATLALASAVFASTLAEATDPVAWLRRHRP